MLKASDYVIKKDGRYHLKQTLITKINVSGLAYSGQTLAITDDEIAVFKPFSWDGATGIHDGRKDEQGIPLNWLATCIHDALMLEASKGGRLPLSYKQIDMIFKAELKKIDAWYRGLWYWGVRLFGRFFR